MNSAEVLRPEVPATEARNLKKKPKVEGEGARGVLVYVDQKPVRLAKNRVALVQETLEFHTCISYMSRYPLTCWGNAMHV